MATAVDSWTPDTAFSSCEAKSSPPPPWSIEPCTPFLWRAGAGWLHNLSPVVMSTEGGNAQPITKFKNIHVAIRRILFLSHHSATWLWRNHAFLFNCTVLILTFIHPPTNLPTHSLFHPPKPLLGQINPVYTNTPHFFGIYFNISLPSTPRSPKWFLPFGFLDPSSHHAC
jgi:hypothetical protein